jgi:hypothetical protein
MCCFWLEICPKFWDKNVSGKFSAEMGVSQNRFLNDNSASACTAVQSKRARAFTTSAISSVMV